MSQNRHSLHVFGVQISRVEELESLFLEQEQEPFKYRKAVSFAIRLCSDPHLWSWLIDHFIWLSYQTETILRAIAQWGIQLSVEISTIVFNKLIKCKHERHVGLMNDHGGHLVNQPWILYNDWKCPISSTGCRDWIFAKGLRHNTSRQSVKPWNS